MKQILSLFSHSIFAVAYRLPADNWANANVIGFASIGIDRIVIAISDRYFCADISTSVWAKLISAVSQSIIAIDLNNAVNKPAVNRSCQTAHGDCSEMVVDYAR